MTTNGKGTNITPDRHSSAATGKIFAQNDEPERLSTFLSGALLPVHFERHPAETRFHYSSEIMVADDVLIWSSYTKTGYVAEWNEAASHRLELHFVDMGESRSETRKQNAAASTGYVYLLHDSRGHRAFVTRGTREVCISVPFVSFARIATANGTDALQALRDLRPVVEASHPAARAIRDIANVLHADGQIDSPFASLPLSTAMLKEALIQTLIASWPRTEAAPPYRPAPRLIRRATKWIEKNLPKKIALAEVASAAGTSSRTLQVAFQEQMGMSPMQYVVELRLRNIHRDLSNIGNTQTIGEIAKAWGFRHSGDFERYYKRRYGITPSETRRHARSQ